LGGLLDVLRTPEDVVRSTSIPDGEGAFQPPTQPATV